MFRRVLVALCVLGSAALPLAVHAQAAAKPHFPTTNDLRQVKALGQPQLSPNGRQALFTVTDSTADGAKSHLWVVPIPADGQQARQITFSSPSDKRGEHDARWSPDGNAVFFLAKRGEHTQLFRLDMRGGEAAPYDLKVLPMVDESKEKGAIPPHKAGKSSEKGKKNAKVEPLPIDVTGYAISHDGKWLAVWARDPQTPGEKAQKKAKADAHWVDHQQHLTRLYLAAFKPSGRLEGTLRPISVTPNIRQAVWSPDADQLLVFTRAPNNAGDLGPAAAAWLVQAGDPATAHKLTAVPATVTGGTFRPASHQIVFAAQTPEDAPPGYSELFQLSLAGSSAPRRLTAGFKGQIGYGALEFDSDGLLVTTAGIGTHTAPVRIALSGAARPKVLDLGASVINGLATNPRHTGWLWLAQSGGHPAQLCYAAHLGDPCSALPIPALEPAGLRAVAPRLIHWKSGSLTIDGLLYLPPQAASGKVPLIVEVHGGPFGAWQNRYDVWANFLVGHGWAVLRPNPRGSSNYGVAFAAANKDDLGGGDYRDIMAGVDYVLAHFPLDSSRMALMGYSYGGEMAGFVEGKTDRFKAIVCGAPVIDQFSEYGTEGSSWYDRWYFGKPWLRMQDAWRQSPLSGVAHAKTPFLLLQGQADTTDPIGQSQEMYRALRQQGVPVDLVTYPREDHGPLARGIFGYPSPEPWHGYDARQRIISFLLKALGEPSKP